MARAQARDSQAEGEGTAGAGTGGARRLLVVAAEEVVGEPLIGRLRERAAGDGRVEVRIVAPALAETWLDHVAGEVDRGIAAASERLRRSCERLSRQGVEVSGAIGDADPILAIEDALAQFPADEIILVTHPDGEARWMEDDLYERARREFEQPIVHVELERHGDRGEIVDVERSGPGREPPSETEVEGRSRNLPRFSVRDLAGIVVGIVGTLVLIVLAAQCSGDDSGLAEGADTGCVVRYLLAGAAALINLAHIVALTMMESVGYRGFWERFFAISSLYGTPLAIVVSLLVH